MKDTITLNGKTYEPVPSIQGRRVGDLALVVLKHMDHIVDGGSFFFREVAPPQPPEGVISLLDTDDGGSPGDHEDINDLDGNSTNYNWHQLVTWIRYKLAEEAK